ncbi:MAG: ATPase, T2SS/T4P/T4SS family [Gammaproteobacteria bacterium]
MPAELLRDRIGTTMRLAPGPDFNEPAALDTFLHGIDQCVAAKDLWVAVDLELVSHLGSAALEALVDAHHLLASRGGSLSLLNVNALNSDILRLTGIDEYVEFISAAFEDAPRRPSRAGARLGDLLVEQDLLDEARVAEAVRLQGETGKKMGRILVDKGWVSEPDLLRVLALQLGVPYARLRPGLYDPDVVGTLDRATCLRLTVLPLFKVHDTLTLATMDPQAVPVIDEVEERSGCYVRPVLVASGEIREVIDHALQGGVAVNDLLGNFEEDFELVDNALPDNLAVIDEMAAGSPVINLVNAIIQRAIRDGASDIHIEPSRTRSRVRFRIDGMLYEGMASPIDVHAAAVSRLKVMANLDITERRLPQDGRIQVSTGGRVVDLRFSSLPGIFGEKVVLRVLDRQSGIVQLDRLGMAAANLELFRGLLARSHGLLPVTGPTGSGKTTTLYAAVEYLNSSEKSLVTIEDPVEYQMDTVNQNQVNEATGLSFARLLRHVLRQDPDVVMVGEIRDRETAQIAVQAALTGHLVLSTLHTNDAISAVTRLVDMGVEPYLLSSALVGVVGQRLVRTVCEHCRTSYVAPPELVERCRAEPGARLRLARGRGCGQCYDSGYKGRLGIHEIVEASGELQSLMVTAPSRDDLSDYVARHRVPTLLDDGLLRVREGQTTLEEVGRVLGHVG